MQCCMAQNFLNMIEETKPSASSLSREQALKWAVRLQSGEWTEADRQSLECWLREDPAHQYELERFTEIWSKLAETPPLLTEEISEAEQYWESHAPLFWSARRGNFLRWGQTCAVMGAIIVVVLGLGWWWPNMTGPMQFYQTAKGEQQTIKLGDGSTVVMNTDSKLSVQLSDHERIVKLQQGEALFTVAHDNQRSFEVHAGVGIVRDIGTKFLVHQSPKKVQVAVLEGIVEVELNKNQDMRQTSRLRELIAGEQVHYTYESEMSSIDAFNSDADLAWVDGKLIFVEKPLKEVLSEWARYRSETIQLDDPSLGTIPISGVFYINNIGSFFQALQKVLPIKPIYVSSQLVILTHQSNS